MALDKDLKLKIKSIKAIQRISKKVSGEWRTELGKITKHTGEMNYAAGLLEYAQTDKERDQAKEYLSQCLSRVVIHTAFLASEFGIDLEEEIPDDLFDLILDMQGMNDHIALRFLTDSQEED